jgi:hypothetical protein
MTTSKSNGPTIDPTDMGNNQQVFLKNPPFNVAKQYQDSENAVNIPPFSSGIDTSVNQGFVKDAPNLGFCLPFLPCNKP